MVLMTRGRKEKPVFDSSDAIFTGISGMAEMFDSRDLYAELISDTIDGAGIFPNEAISVSFRIVMAKRENSGLSARYIALPFLLPVNVVGRHIQVLFLSMHRLTLFDDSGWSGIEKRGTLNSISTDEMAVKRAGITSMYW